MPQVQRRHSYGAFIIIFEITFTSLCELQLAKFWFLEISSGFSPDSSEFWKVWENICIIIMFMVENDAMIYLRFYNLRGKLLVGGYKLSHFMNLVLRVKQMVNDDSYSQVITWIVFWWTSSHPLHLQLQIHISIKIQLIM